MKNLKHTILLFIIIAVFLVSNFIIIQKDTTPIFYDETQFFSQSYEYMQSIIYNPTQVIHTIIGHSQHRPPFFPLSIIPVYLAFGFSEDIARLSTSIFVVILMLSIYGIGREIKDAQTGILAGTITMSIPIMIGFSRTIYLDIPAAALVCASIYFLIKSEFFKKKKESIWLGITLGLAILTKKNAILFLVAPLIYAIFISLKNKRYYNTIMSVLLAGIISLPWYLSKLRYLIKGLIDIGAIQSNQTFLSLNNLLYFPIFLLNYMVFKLVVWIFLVAFIIRIISKKRKYETLIFIWLISSLIIFAAINNVFRYYLGAIPAIGIITAIFISTLFKKNKWIIYLFIFLFLGMFLHTSYSNLERKPIFDIDNYVTMGMIKANDYNWVHDEVTETIISLSKNNSISRVIFIVQIGEVFHPAMNKLYFLGYDIEMIMPTETTNIFEINDILNKSQKKLILSSEIIVDVENYDGEHKELVKRFQEDFYAVKEHFRLEKEIIMQDGRILEVYSKI